MVVGGEADPEGRKPADAVIAMWNVPWLQCSSMGPEWECAFRSGSDDNVTQRTLSIDSRPEPQTGWSGKFGAVAEHNLPRDALPQTVDVRAQRQFDRPGADLLQG